MFPSLRSKLHKYDFLHPTRIARQICTHCIPIKTRSALTRNHSLSIQLIEVMGIAKPLYQYHCCMHFVALPSSMSIGLMEWKTCTDHTMILRPLWRTLEGKTNKHQPRWMAHVIKNSYLSDNQIPIFIFQQFTTNGPGTAQYLNVQCEQQQLAHKTCGWWFNPHMYITIYLHEVRIA